MRIGIDLMGADSPPTPLFEAALKAARQSLYACTFVFFATHIWIERLSLAYEAALKSCSKANFEFYPCIEFITMGDEPLVTLQSKKDSSILVGLKCLKQKSIDALVSAGNTGALIAGATLGLSKLAGIKRPGLLAVLPTKHKDVAIMDVGGNVACKALQLLQFAVMGAAYCHLVPNIEIPTVGLLNIGAESKKGSRELQHVYRGLQELALYDFKGKKLFEFAGNIEGRDVFKGEIDLLITDGFTGNIFLKTAEGTAAFMLDVFEKYRKAESLSSHNLPAIPAIQALKERFSYKEYPGAVLCGVDGVVIKCHGEASISSFYHSILAAQFLVARNFTVNLKAFMYENDLLAHLSKVK